MRINFTFRVLSMGMLLCGGALSVNALPLKPQQIPEENVAVETGKYTGDWDNLSQWECPEWFKDAKFGIWAHWGPQCEAEGGDWYARGMYFQGGGQYNWHVNRYGNPKTFGFKDVINEWEAEEWDPQALIDLYYEAGARYFFTLGQHHDNFDLWNSPYQPWNSVNMGPMRDLVGEWMKACEKYNLPVGVSMHGAHTWTWFEIAQDYDGNLTKEDGEGLWWEGYDPQDLYAQQHTPSANYRQSGTIHSQWDWGNGASLPSEEYKMKFQNRVLQCINDYNPAMIYFDDTVLPFWGCDEGIGLNILEHYYNHDANNGGEGVVVMGKQLRDMHKQALLWDVERGIPDRIQPQYWQTCTCIGSWHYDVNNTNYKSAQQVIRMLVDVVSKNGNMLLSIPIRGNGTIDSKECEVVKGITAWMKVNSESIYGTRPWLTFGEGPQADAANPLTAQGFNESNNYSWRDVRYVTKDGKLYATIMDLPEASSEFVFTALGYASPYFSGEVESIRLLGYEETIPYNLDFNGLKVTIPQTKCNDIAPVFEIVLNPENVSVSFEGFIDYFQGQLNQLQNRSAYMNTGLYDSKKVEALSDALEEAKQFIGANETEQQQALQRLQQTYQEVKKNGTNPGGICDQEGEDVTVQFLTEAGPFSRAEGTDNGRRFGRPKYWTVENFKIDNYSNGLKEGIDKYAGSNALMLGVWDDQSRNAEGDLSDARIYQKIQLPAGCYFFGAKYNALYQLSEAYIFAAAETIPTSEIPERALAYYPIMLAETGNTYYGISFCLEQDQEIILGFQADLSGNSTQEFRADGVQLLYLGSADYRCEDLTIEKLMEKDNFSRFIATDDDSRFAKPLYWEVDNFNIPCGTDGAKEGIDHYPGYNCLMLGVWDDRKNNVGGDISQARIYRKIHLDEGTYSFGAMFQTTYNISENAYMFVSQEILQTNEIPSQAMAYLPISGCGENDGKWYSVKFTLDQPADIIVGFQADLTGANQQEFRVRAVRLQKIEGTTGVTDVIVDSGISSVKGPTRYFSITGIELPTEPQSGLYIRMDGNRVSKLVKR